MIASRKIRTLPEPAVRRAIRQSGGLTLADFAQLLGVAKATISRWETGMREPQGEMRTAYAELLERLSQVVAERA